MIDLALSYVNNIICHKVKPQAEGGKEKGRRHIELKVCANQISGIRMVQGASVSFNSTPLLLHSLVAMYKDYHPEL